LANYWRCPALAVAADALPSPLPAALIRHSPNTRRLCSSRISSPMLVCDSRTNSANGAFGRHERQENAGMRLVTAASR
jgi:hypothetical protein